MNPIANEYRATARMNDRVREASGRTAPVRRQNGAGRFVARLVSVLPSRRHAARRPEPRHA